VDEVIGDFSNPDSVEAGPVWRFTTESEPSKPCEDYHYDGDIDGDCLVDMTDLILLIQDWMRTSVVTDADINQDGTVDMADFTFLGRDWLSDIERQKPLLMFISTHPDDEGIFFGGTMPYYARVLNFPVVHISVTSGDWHLHNLDVRETELTNADAIYFGRPVTTSVGLFPNPSADLHFLRRRDVSGGSYPYVDQVWDWWHNNVYDDYADTEDGKRLVIDTLATYIRVFRPDVIATQDFDGEYGHPNHKAVAIGVADGYDRAADPDYVDGNPPWTAKKLYIHQSEANGLGTVGRDFINWLFHDHCEETSIDTNGDGIADMTPRQVADWGLNQHISQGRPDVSTVYRTGENFDGHHSEWWGLYRSTVGPDTIAHPFTIMGKAYNNGANNGWAIGNFLENLSGTRTP
jgi:LmbE family N-acetylglucosaminyl deacetylase